jgi:hypothetical protein
MNEPLLFEYSGWAFCNENECDSANFSALPSDEWQKRNPSAVRLTERAIAQSLGTPRDGTCLTHVGCKSRFPNWHLSVMLWDVYHENSENRLICPDCHSVLPKEAYEIFCKVYNLLNRQ